MKMLYTAVSHRNGNYYDFGVFTETADEAIQLCKEQLMHMTSEQRELETFHAEGYMVPDSIDSLYDYYDLFDIVPPADYYCEVDLDDSGKFTLREK